MNEEYKWLTLLQNWKASMEDLYENNEDKWRMFGLPNVDQLNIKRPADDVIKEAERRFGSLDREIVEFYSATDGWPLWLGSKSCYILPVQNIDYFKAKYPIAYEDATEYCFEERIIEEHGQVHLSQADFERALVVSGPDAREFVLILASGETCLYQFDWAGLFDNFFLFMKYRYKEVLEEVRDFLS